MFLLASIALAVGLARLTGIALSKAVLLVPLLLGAAGPFVRRYLQRKRGGYPGT